MATKSVWRLVGVLLAVLLAAAPAQALVFHTVDQDHNFRISLTELLRIIQFFNSGGFSCLEGTEDGYAPDPGGDKSCNAHDSDYNPGDWKIGLTELLRVIQFFNTNGYGFDVTTEDGFRPIMEAPPDDTGPDQQAEEVDALLGDWPDDLDPKDGERLRDILAGARDAYGDSDPCGAADVLDGLIGDPVFTPGTTRNRAARATAATAAYTDLLYMQTRNLQYDIVIEAATQKSPCTGRERFGKEAEPGVEDGSTSNLAGTVRFGMPRFSPAVPPEETMGRVLFSQMHQPGFQDQSGEPGTPWIPSSRHLVAIPPDSFVTLTSNASIGETFSLAVAPFQPQPVDQKINPQPEPPGFELFADLPFMLNENIYSSSTPYPRAPVRMLRLGKFRGMDLVQLELFGGQYNPDTEAVTLFNEVSFDLDFANGPAGFLYNFNGNPFESSPDVYLSAVLNRDIVVAAPKLDWTIAPEFAGEEFMIITHPDFRAAADTLAAWKNEKGIMTNVYEGGTGSGITDRETADQIDNFIEWHYDVAGIKPTYILLLGDAEFIPPFYPQRLGADPGVTIGTDWFYAIYDPPGTEFPTLVPTFATGRIPVDTLQQANDVVNKIIAYEQTPPGGGTADPFYSRAAIAAEFQCCRTDTDIQGVAQRSFTEVSELVRSAMTMEGYQVDRIYQVTVDNGCATCDPTRAAYTGDPTPRRYHLGAPLPAAIGPDSGFAWDGDTNDILDAWNEGRFLILHRDHGWPGGWSTPSLHWGHLNLLDNGAWQPVVFSINCSSGLWDNETDPGADGTSVDGVYFAEQLLRDPVNGAVGLICDTRVSPTWANSALTRGLYDAIFTNTLPAYGTGVSHRRLGDILNYAKMYLLTQVDVAGQGTSYGDAVNELYLYHVLGDPTMEIWTEDPDKLPLPSGFSIINIQESKIEIGYPLDEAIITAYKETPNGLFPIGRAKVVDGVATLDLVQFPGEGTLSLAASAENAVPQNGSVEVTLETR